MTTTLAPMVWCITHNGTGPLTARTAHILTPECRDAHLAEGVERPAPYVRPEADKLEEALAILYYALSSGEREQVDAESTVGGKLVIAARCLRRRKAI